MKTTKVKDIKVIDGTVYGENIVFSAYILYPNLSKDTEYPVEVIIDNVAKGTVEYAETVLEKHRGEIETQLPKKSKCVVCEKIIDKKSDRVGSPQFCSSLKCRAKASYAKKQITQGDFNEGIFYFGHRGQMNGSTIEKIKKNTYRIVYQGKDKKSASIIRIDNKKEDGIFIGKNRYAHIEKADGDYQPLGIFSVYLLISFFAQQDDNFSLVWQN